MAPQAHLLASRPEVAIHLAIGLTRKMRIAQPFAMNFLNRYADPFYCIMRLIVGLMFACHGLDKIFGTFAGKTEALPPLMMVGGWVEIICGFLVALGLLTRVASFVASGEMAAAFFMMHAPNGLIPYVNKGELAVVYCFIFFYIFLRGPGAWSLDSMFCRKSTSAASPAV
jgi:putative oxidoreductase